MRRADAYSPARLARGALRRANAARVLAGLFAAAAARRAWGRPARPEILLHAGAHKTGTSSIQGVIIAERRSLARQGYHVARAGQGVDGAHHRLFFTLLGRWHSPLTVAMLRAELVTAPPRSILISSETVTKAVVEGDGARVIDALREAGAARVRLLLYVRSPFALASSSYSSRIGRLDLGGTTFDEYVREHDSGSVHRYDRFLELAQRDDVDLSVRPYSESARRSILQDFAKALGVDLRDAREPRRNASFGPIGLEAMRLIAAEFGPFRDDLRPHLWPPLRRIARSLGEQPFWGIDESREGELATADRRTDEFARAVWGRGWREAIGEERRPLNVFDPSDPAQQAALQAALREMRSACARILAERRDSPAVGDDQSAGSAPSPAIARRSSSSRRT
jgi:hypothetical protein